MAPGFEPLSAQLGRLNLLLQAQVTLRMPEEVPAGADGARGRRPARWRSAAVASRQDAVRALDAVAEFSDATSHRVRCRC